MQEFDLARVTPSPAVFDFEKLYWLNRHYIKQSSPERVTALAEPFLLRAVGLSESTADISAWLGHITAALSHSVNKLDELPERAASVLHFDPAAAISAAENQEILAAESSRTVLAAVAAKLEAEAAPLEAARFKAILKEVQKETGIKGPALFHPVRIALTGQQSGPEFDRLVPLMEEGSRLTLPKPVPSVCQRLTAFLAAQKVR